MPMGMMGGIGVAFVAVFCLVFAVLYVVIGVGLLKLQNWARVLAIVLTGLSVLAFVSSILSPFAHMHLFFFAFLIRRLILVAIDIWILVYLFKPNVKQAFGATGF